MMGVKKLLIAERRVADGQINAFRRDQDFLKAFINIVGIGIKILTDGGGQRIEFHGNEMFFLIAHSFRHDAAEMTDAG